MKKHPVLLIAAACAVQLAFAGAAFAQTSTGYDPAGNRTVAVQAPVSLPLGSCTGNLSFDVQEGLYRTLGLNIPHDYVFVGVNSANLLAIDPPMPMFNPKKRTGASC